MKMKLKLKMNQTMKKLKNFDFKILKTVLNLPPMEDQFAPFLCKKQPQKSLFFQARYCQRNCKLLLDFLTYFELSSHSRNIKINLVCFLQILFSPLDSNSTIFIESNDPHIFLNAPLIFWHFCFQNPEVKGTFFPLIPLRKS